MATEQAAARDRVLAARAEFDDEAQRLEASVRAAVDIPTRLKRNPAKVAAVAGGVGFLALKGPARVFRGAKRVVRGKPEPLPTAMLPAEIEKALKRMGPDGAKVRGALERDFADYAAQSQKSRDSFRTVLILTAARPLLGRASKALGEFLFTPDGDSFVERLAKLRDRPDRKPSGSPPESNAPDGPSPPA